MENPKEQLQKKTPPYSHHIYHLSLFYETILSHAADTVRTTADTDPVSHGAQH